MLLIDLNIRLRLVRFEHKNHKNNRTNTLWRKWSHCSHKQILQWLVCAKNVIFLQFDPTIKCTLQSWAKWLLWLGVLCILSCEWVTVASRYPWTQSRFNLDYHHSTLSWLIFWQIKLSSCYVFDPFASQQTEWKFTSLVFSMWVETNS